MDFPAIQAFLIRAELQGLGDAGPRCFHDPQRQQHGRDHQGQPQISGRCPACGSCDGLVFSWRWRCYRRRRTQHLSPCSRRLPLKPGFSPWRRNIPPAPGRPCQWAGGSRAKVIDALKSGPADVVVLPTSDIADLPNVTGMVPLGRITVGVAVKAGAKVPDISTPEKFRAALLAAKGVAYADPAAGTSAGQGDRRDAVRRRSSRASSACRCRAWR